LILFYNSTNEPKRPNEKIPQSWADLIKDRLYTKPNKQNRPVNMTFDGWEDGKPILENNQKQKILPDGRRFTLDDNKGNYKIYIFSKSRGVIHSGSLPPK
jgi:hypothetical protein